MTKNSSHTLPLFHLPGQSSSKSIAASSACLMPDRVDGVLPHQLHRDIGHWALDLGGAGNWIRRPWQGRMAGRHHFPQATRGLALALKPAKPAPPSTSRASEWPHWAPPALPPSDAPQRLSTRRAIPQEPPLATLGEHLAEVIALQSLCGLAKSVWKALAVVGSWLCSLALGEAAKDLGERTTGFNTICGLPWWFVICFLCEGKLRYRRPAAG